MVFSTLFFLFVYLPIVLFIHYITPCKYRNAVLLAVNLIFYGWKKPIYLLIMFASVAIDYIHGLLVEKAKAAGAFSRARRYVVQSVLFNLALLFFFKYWDFIASIFAAAGADFMPKLGLELPIGISFYTFQTMSYTVDVYRGDAEAQKNIVSFGTFVTLFPQLIAGPILKYKDLAAQIEKRTYTTEKFAAGVRHLCIGLAKKVLLANNIGALWEVCKATGAEALTLGTAVLGVVAFSFQLYFDFSGYSDMAVGLGEMLGFSFRGNFNYPYIAESITDFWRRWHMSLSSWFRDYLYIPLGGSRKGKVRTALNLLLVWTATGLWHGAGFNFLLWGLYYAILLIGEKFLWGNALAAAPAVLRHVYTLVLVGFGWALFSLEDFSTLGYYVKAMFGFGAAGGADAVFFRLLKSHVPILALCCVGATPLPRLAWERLPEKLRLAAEPCLIVAALLFSTAYLADGSYNPFLYFQF